MTYIQKLSANDKEFENKLLSIIKIEFPEEKSQYLNNISARNLLEASKNVHKLKHKISILGLEKSYRIAERFENNLVEGQTALQDDFEAVLEVITQYLNAQ